MSTDWWRGESVEHDGSAGQYANMCNEHDDVSAFTVGPSVTSIGASAFLSSPLTGLSGLRGSAVASIGPRAFARCADLAALAGLPPALARVGWRAFEACHSLRNLRGLPLPCDVDAAAFENCRGLQVRAGELGFPRDKWGVADVASWVEDRRLIPGRRAMVLLCVRYAVDRQGLEGGGEGGGEGEGEGEAGGEGEAEGQPEPVAPLLKLIVRLPDEIIREIATMAFGDHA
ncbi:hypothetical protein TeGR_g5209 [Tetraparma gracilis]|uniref:Uncharacterized protein n=1 Tax=Tetraparma gracilis TaxID=2962635 RepID=A0ABQ6MH02_9STRA|nr:hypothetical protein TeGR_g5209 [Tetraparma gracilis]